MPKAVKTDKKPETAAQFAERTNKDSRKRNGTRANFAWKKDQH